MDEYLRENNKYTKGESKITFPDVQDCLMLVSSNFSTQTSYENQTKKAITNKFIQDAMTEFLRQQLEVYFIENHDDAEQHRRPGAHQQAQPGDGGAYPPEHQEKADGARSTLPTGCRSSWTAAPRTWTGGRSTSWRATPLWAPASSPGTRSSRGIMPVRGKILNCLKADYRPDLQKR